MLTAPDSPGFSLRNILANGELVGSTPDGELLRIDTAHVKVKIILFYLLTKGVWQFFNSELMPNEWTKDTVEFLVEYREHRGALTAGVFLNQPLIPAQLHSAPKRQEEAPNHSFPKIRELGIMLLEILLGRQIESFRGLPEFAAYLPGGEPTPYTNYRIATWLFEKRVKMDQQIAKPLIKVVERSLDPVFFLKLLAPGKGKDQGHSRLRDAMYEKLVVPLDLLVKTNYDDTHGLWPLHELGAAAAPLHGVGTTEAPDLTRPFFSTRQSIAQSATDMESEAMCVPVSLFTTCLDALLCSQNVRLTIDTSPLCGEPSQRWFDDLDVVKALLLAGHGSRKVRVAVIDTGFSPRWGAIPWNIRKGNYKDFVDARDDDRRDDTGHGTYLARLICKIMPKVELYAARVLKNGLLSEESCELVENVSTPGAHLLTPRSGLRKLIMINTGNRLGSGKRGRYHTDGLGWQQGLRQREEGHQQTARHHPLRCRCREPTALQAGYLPRQDAEKRHVHLCRDGQQQELEGAQPAAAEPRIQLCHARGGSPAGRQLGPPTERNLLRCRNSCSLRRHAATFLMADPPGRRK